RRRPCAIGRARAVGARTVAASPLDARRVVLSLATRRTCGHDRARDRLIGRPRPAPARGDEARRVRGHADRRARRLEMTDVDLRDARLLDRATAEMILA